MTDQKEDSVSEAAETSMDKLRRASKVAYSTVTLTDAEADALVAEVERLRAAKENAETMCEQQAVENGRVLGELMAAVEEAEQLRAERDEWESLYKRSIRNEGAALQENEKLRDERDAWGKAWREETAEFREREQRLQEALRYYAREAPHPVSGEYGRDSGEVARAALETDPQEEA